MIVNVVVIDAICVVGDHAVVCFSSVYNDCCDCDCDLCTQCWCW